MYAKVILSYTITLVVIVSLLVNYVEGRDRVPRRERGLEAEISGSPIRPSSILVEAFSPRGLKVSIPDVEGLQLFAFHGKINSPIRRNEAGNLSEDIRQPTNGRWVYWNPDIRLRVGDILNFWIFLQIDGQGMRLHNLSFVIRELIPNRNDITTPIVAQYPYPSSDTSTTAHTSYCNTCGRRTSTTTAPISPTQHLHLTPRPTYPTSHQVQYSTPYGHRTSNTLGGCECNREELTKLQEDFNATVYQLELFQRRMAPLQAKVDSLTDLLQDLLQHMNIGTKLLLIGQQPPGTNPLEAVRALITQKLGLFDLEYSIAQATQTSSGILFEVLTPIDKKRILFHAQRKLINSNYQIVDYLDEGSPSTIRTTSTSHPVAAGTGVSQGSGPEHDFDIRGDF